MTRSEWSLLATRRFLPLFATQFLGAMNDNVFKNALVILTLYRIAGEGGGDGAVMVTVAAGLFMLPFFLFSATAGQVADKFEKSRLIRGIKLAEIAIMALGGVALFVGEPSFLMAVLFLMGTQSTFFGPLKYGILPDHLREDELVAGNGLIEAGTFVAILLGTVIGGLLVLRDGGIAAVTAIVLAVAVAGWLASRAIPAAPPSRPDLRLEANVLAETWRMIRHVAGERTLLLTVIGLSWFWLVGATFLSQFPALAKDVIGAGEGVVTLFLTAFAVGIGAGSMLCNSLAKGEVTPKFVPLAAVGITVFIADLCVAVSGRVPGPEEIDAAAFLSEARNWRVLGDLVAIAVCGGLFSVPLYAILQNASAPGHRARNIAANNVVNALFMVAGALLAAGMLAAGGSVAAIFAVTAVLNGLVALYICRLLPQYLVKGVLAAVLRLAFRVEVRGLEHYRAASPRAVIVANHVSFLDAVLLAVFLPGRPMFAIDTFIARRWWVRPFLGLVEAFPVDPTNPFAAKALIREVKSGKRLVIFPEGRITVTGALMKVHEGPGLIADKADADLVPVRIGGAEATLFSRMGGKMRRRLFPRVTLTVLPPRRFRVPEGVYGRRRRRITADQLYDVMSDLMFETCDTGRTLFEALLEARHVHGGGAEVLVDIERRPASYDRIVLGSLVLGRRLAGLSNPGEAVGLLLPNAVGTAVAFFALQACGRVPAMLNFSTGAAAVAGACRTARLRTVLTSRRFVEAGRLQGLVEAIAAEATVVYLEDLRAGIGRAEGLLGVLRRPFAAALHRRCGALPDDPAVILFTSGSEGAPKGVVLSHRNLLANRYQIAARVDFNASDVAFNALPVFHSFGLTGGLLLPLLSGVRTFLYPSPLHYRIVPALVYDTNATILFGTDTFLSGYARLASPYDFFNVRHVFAGAERVRDETRRTWAEKFGLRILEGYGATETSPVIAVNTPMHFRAGTVGRAVPGLETRLEPVPGIDRGGRLFVRGPNVMLGYLLADRPGELQPPPDGTYDTGDIVDIDADGFLTILGRAKRFAKVAGEMVSLGAVEQLVHRLWPDAAHAVVALPDPRKGEQLVLVTAQADADRAALQAAARRDGVAELMVPRTVVVVDAVPLLGTGKTDYPAATRIARERVAVDA